MILADLFANEDNYILFTIIAIVVTLLLIFLVVWRIKVNARKYKEESETILDETLSRTGIRNSVEKYIDKVGAYGACGLIYLDVDGFGDLNDLLGNKSCDDLLREIALRILKVMPFKAQLARYQNDEFLVFIKDENSRDFLEETAQKLLDIINMPYHVMDGGDINITCSVGVVSYPSCGISFQELINNLELATYVSKRDGGNKFTYYYTELAEEETGNMEYFKEIKNAIKNKEFVLYYQPMIDIEKNNIYGAEALMRWNHPEKGVLPPNKFLSVLEQSGDIKWVGQWGLESMIKEYLYMNDKYPQIDLKFSLNLSTKQLMDPLLSNSFIDTVKRYKVEPQHFMLEIAEFTMYDKLGQVKNNLLKLKDYGFLVAIDGFDLDYSTMAGIERAPLDIIKLDRGFLKTMDNNFMKEKFVAMLVEFARKNDHEVICEGVENDEMVKYVRRNNVHICQGYYYSKPIPENELDEYIANRKWRKGQSTLTQTQNVSMEDMPAAPDFNKDNPQPTLTDSQTTYVDFESQANALKADFGAGDQTPDFGINSNSSKGKEDNEFGDQGETKYEDVNFDEDSSKNAKF